MVAESRKCLPCISRLPAGHSSATSACTPRWFKKPKPPHPKLPTQTQGCVRQQPQKVLPQLLEFCSEAWPESHFTWAGVFGAQKTQQWSLRSSKLMAQAGVNLHPMQTTTSTGRKIKNKKKKEKRATRTYTHTRTLAVSSSSSLH